MPGAATAGDPSWTRRFERASLSRVIRRGDENTELSAPPGAEARASTAGSILVCTGHFWPHVGGVERHALELWGRLARRGWRVRFLTSNTEGAAERETVRGMEVFRLPAWNLMDRRFPVPLPSAALARGLHWLGTDKPDVIVTNTRFFPATALGIALARAWSLPTLHIEHGSGHVVTGSATGDRVSQLVDHTVGRVVLNAATRCVGVSEAVVSFVRSLGRQDAGVLYNGVDTASFGVDGRAQRGALGIPADAPLILFVGRLYADKGVLALWDAFQRLPEALGAHLVLAGDGPLLEPLRAKLTAAPRVSLLGFVQGKQVPALLAASDIVAHPSECSEGMPTVVLEAAAAGRAIVATRVGGTAEIVQDGLTGLLTDPGDAVALRQALELLCRDPSLRARLGAAARARCQAVFDWSQIAAQVEQELSTLMATADARATPEG